MKKFAENGSLLLFSLTIFFHLLVLTGIIPYSIVWGGRLASTNEMYLFESISIVLNLFFILIISVKSGKIPLPVPMKFVRGALWLMFVVFLLNTIGNLFAESTTETVIFTPITGILSVFCFISLRST